LFDSELSNGVVFSGQAFKGAMLFRSLLAVALFCISTFAQQKVPLPKAGPLPVPVLDVKLSPDPNLSIALPDNMLVLGTQCDTDGNPYADVMTLAPPFRQTVAFTKKGVVMFATNQMTDIPEAQMLPSFVAGSGVYAIVAGIENAKKEEVTAKDDDGKEVKWIRTSGESRAYIARFDADGSYRGALKLDAGFQPIQLAAFGSGDFAAAGVDENKTPRVGVLNSRGQLLEYLRLPKDITDRPKSTEKSFDRFGSASIAEKPPGRVQIRKAQETFVTKWAGRAMDHFSYLIDRQHRFLLIGIILLIVAVVFTFAGESLERYGRMVSRVEEPKQFRWNVATFYLGGIFFIALYLYKISN
jgi:hypothetical protein